MSVGDHRLIVSGDAVLTLGTTKLGLDAEGDDAPKVTTESGPAKQTFAKVG